MPPAPRSGTGRGLWITAGLLAALVVAPLLLVYATNFLHLRWYLQGAMGNVYAMLHLGEVHLHRGDYPLARYWFEQAAKRGNAVGMFEMYRFSATIESGKPWLIKAAEADLPEAMIELKDNYLYGRAGFEIDREKAEYWANQEAENFKRSLIKQGTSFEEWQRDRGNWTKDDRDHNPELFQDRNRKPNGPPSGELP